MLKLVVTPLDGVNHWIPELLFFFLWGISSNDDEGTPSWLYLLAIFLGVGFFAVGGILWEWWTMESISVIAILAVMLILTGVVGGVFMLGRYVGKRSTWGREARTISTEEVGVNES